MTPLQQAQLQLGETRQKLAEAIAATEPDTALIESLTTEIRAQDAKTNAIVALEVDSTTVVKETPEGREMRHLLGSASLGRMMTGIANDEAGAGADAELRQHLGLPANYIPWDMLCENRAALAMTGDEDGNQTPWINTVFPMGAAAFCQVDVSTVAVGLQTVPIVGTGLTIAFPGENTAPAESVPTAAVTTLTPQGRTGILSGFSKTDLLLFPMLEEAWRQEMNAAIQNALDLDLLTLNNKGLLSFGAAPANPTAATTAAAFLADCYGAVDGAMASSVDQIRMLVGPETYGYMGGLAYDAGSGLTVADKLRSIGVQILATDNAGDYASNRQEGLVIVGPPRRNAVAVAWGGIEVIRDEFSQASKGQVVFNVAAHWDFEVMKAAGYTRQRYRNT